jgi:endonuclease III
MLSVKQLRSALGGTISVEAVVAADETTIASAINKVGFWRRKSQFVSQLCIPLVSIEKNMKIYQTDGPKTERRFQL